jgi:hypothetical protein
MVGTTDKWISIIKNKNHSFLKLKKTQNLNLFWMNAIGLPNKCGFSQPFRSDDSGDTTLFWFIEKKLVWRIRSTKFPLVAARQHITQVSQHHLCNSLAYCNTFAVISEALVKSNYIFLVSWQFLTFGWHHDILRPRRDRRTSIVPCSSNRIVQSETHRTTSQQRTQQRQRTTNLPHMCWRETATHTKCVL